MYAGALIMLLSIVTAPALAAQPTLHIHQSTPATLQSSVARGAQRVPYLQLILEAPCDASIVVSGITLTHEGLGAAHDIDGVYLMENATRRTRARAFSSRDGRVELRLRPPMVVSPCGTRTLMVLANIAATAQSAGEHRITLAASADIATEAQVVLETVEQQALTTVVRPSTSGTVTARFLELVNSLSFGANRTLARIQLTADRTADQWVTAITLTNGGSATDADLQRLRLENRAGDVLTNVAASLNGDRVQLTFDPAFRLNRNTTQLLFLKGDIRASRKRTIRFELEEASDLEAEARRR